MINQLLSNPAYYRLYKNATSLNSAEIAKDSADLISTVKSTSAPIINTATVIKTGPPINNGGVNFLVIIGVGLLVGFAAYNIYEYYDKKNKSLKL
jgi:hypothetical protein